MGSDSMQKFIDKLKHRFNRIEYSTIELDRDPKVIRMMHELLDGKVTRVVTFIHDATSRYDDLNADLKFLQSLKPHYVREQVDRLTKDAMQCILLHADYAVNIYIVHKSRCKSHKELVQFFECVLSRKCNSLQYSNYEDLISRAYVEKIIQFVNRLEKKVSFTATTDAPEANAIIGNYWLRIYDLILDKRQLRIKNLEYYPKRY